MIGSNTTKALRIDSIKVPPRIRKQMEQIDALAQDIREHGLLNPITVMHSGGQYVLIAGQRRLEAVRQLGEVAVRATILTAMDAGDALALEYAENVQRQDFTVSERLEFAEKIKAVEQAKARERMANHARDGRDQGRVVRPDPEPPEFNSDMGRSRDAIAKRVGISSGVQLRRAMVVAEKKPELLEKIDSGETTIFGAYREVTEKRRAEQPADTPITSDQVARAKHERLMKNPLYVEAYNGREEATCEANRAKGELRFQVEGFQKVIRGHEENIRAMRRRIERLEEDNEMLCTENAELRQLLQAQK